MLYSGSQSQDVGKSGTLLQAILTAPFRCFAWGAGQASQMRENCICHARICTGNPGYNNYAASSVLGLNLPRVVVSLFA